MEKFIRKAKKIGGFFNYNRKISLKIKLIYYSTLKENNTRIKFDPSSQLGRKKKSQK